MSGCFACTFYCTRLLRYVYTAFLWCFCIYAFLLLIGQRLIWRCVYRASYCNVLMWRVYRASYCNVLITSEMHNFYNQFILFHSFLSALHVSNESSRSSSGAQHNILYYTIVPIVPNCVIHYIMPCCWWWTTRFVRNMQSRQKTVQ